MATCKTKKCLERKEEILDASMYVFFEKGYNTTGIADIADRVGIGKSTVYEYFDSKADLFIESFRWFVKTSKETVIRENKKSKSKSVKRQIAKLIDQKIITTKKDKKISVNYFHLVMEFKSSETSEKITNKLFAALKDAHEEFKNGIVQMLKKGIENGEFRRNIDIRIVSEIIFTATMGMNMQKNLNDKFKRDAVSKEFLKVLFAGISRTKENIGKSKQSGK